MKVPYLKINLKIRLFIRSIVYEMPIVAEAKFSLRRTNTTPDLGINIQGDTIFRE